MLKKKFFSLKILLRKNALTLVDSWFMRNIFKELFLIRNSNNFQWKSDFFQAPSLNFEFPPNLPHPLFRLSQR